MSTDLQIPEPRVEVMINGTRVGFLRRDIRQISDAERSRVEALVAQQQREARPDRVTRIVIETDYADFDRLSYRACVRVSVEGDGEDDGGGEAAPED